MNKNNNSVSQNKIKRAVKNKARKQRRLAEVEKHIAFLYNLSKSHQINLEKVSSYQVYSKYFNQTMTFSRTPKQVKYIIDKLVSLQEANK